MAKLKSLLQKLTKSKSTKEALEVAQGPHLVFDHFNFKLLIIQELMYEQEVLLPKFDVYELAETHPVDFDLSYMEVLPEVRDYFETLEIPASLAPKVERLFLDGGNDIYLQMMPYGDGEGSEFDIEDLSARELAQFTQLKEINGEAVSYFSAKASDFIRSKGILLKEYGKS